uniref:Retrotransposon gag domain-containing protein n=1 Tax=Haemonchus contortus TaxID=6289 RepID=W6NLG8_HAECO
MPLTRSQSSSIAASTSPSPPSIGAGAPEPETELQGNSLITGVDTPNIENAGYGSVTAPLDNSLSRLDDSAVLHVKDGKALRDAASAAITQVWREARSQTSALAHRINEDNASLSSKLNESFTAVGSRLEAIPTIAMLAQDSPSPKIAPFTGSSEDGVQFSIWLRRLNDIIRMRPSELSSEQKANFLIGHLDGVAREKVEELDEGARKSFDAVVTHLRNFFESPQQRYVARQKLSVCKQEPGEAAATFANRVLNLVRSATAGQDPATQKDRVLEEFVSRLRGDIRTPHQLASHCDAMDLFIRIGATTAEDVDTVLFTARLHLSPIGTKRTGRLHLI